MLGQTGPDLLIRGCTVIDQQEPHAPHVPRPSVFGGY